MSSALQKIKALNFRFFTIVSISFVLLAVYILRGKSIIIQRRYRKQLFRYVIFLLLEAPCTSLISNFRRVLNVVCFLLGDSPASEFYMSKFWNTLSVPFS
jgi:hypothetical protein